MTIVVQSGTLRGPSYVKLGSVGALNSNNFIDQSITIPANCQLLVASAFAIAPSMTNLKIDPSGANTAFSAVQTQIGDGSYGIAMYQMDVATSGLGTKTVRLNLSGGFGSKGFVVWSLNNLSSTVTKQSGSLNTTGSSPKNLTISTSSRDLIFFGALTKETTSQVTGAIGAQSLNNFRNDTTTANGFGDLVVTTGGSVLTLSGGGGNIDWLALANTWY